MNPRVNLAEQIARKAFANKKDLAGKPYIQHIERVTSQFPTSLYSEKYSIAAWLHDLLEDCSEDWNEADLRKLFPNEIVDTIVLLTKRKGLDYFEYINGLNNIIALEIKRADSRDNMDLTRLQEISENDIARIQKYHKAYKIVEGYLNELKNPAQNNY